MGGQASFVGGTEEECRGDDEGIWGNGEVTAFQARPGRTALLLADPRGNPPLSKDTKVGEAKEGILQRTQDQVSIRLPYVLTLFACLLYHLSDFPVYW